MNLAPLASIVLLQADTAVQVEEELRWLHLPAAWIVVLIVVPLVVAYVTFFYRREVPIGRGAWRGWLAGLRCAVILLALAMLAEPVRRRTTYETRDSSLLVLVDDSLSMDIVDRYADREHAEKIAEFLDTSVEMVESTSRYDLVRRALSDDRIGLLRRLREKGKVVVDTFAASVEEKGRLTRLRDGEDDAANGNESGGGTGASSDILPPYAEVRNDTRVQETRIADSVRDGVAGVVGSGFGDREERVSGVLVISDGQENSGSASAVEIARRFGERGTPVHAIGIGNPDEAKDVRLTHLDMNEVVLVDDVVPIDATIIADGFEGERVAVRLEIDSRTEASEFVRLEGGGKAQVVRLQYRPRAPGEVTATVEVDRLGGEVFHDNNSLSKTIRVLDEKIRVLYLENLPRWEYRFLQHALIRDVTTETHVWLFSADPDFVQECSPSLQPLASFPRTREELFRYHVVILGDVDPADLGTDVCTLLKEFVDEGGGLVFLSGRHANPAKFVHTDLYPVLPSRCRRLPRSPRVTSAP